MLLAELFYLAEEEGFEPSIEFPQCRFSKPVRSTSRALFRFISVAIN